jgi:hypothetical protein
MRRLHPGRDQEVPVAGNPQYAASVFITASSNRIGNNTVRLCFCSVSNLISFPNAVSTSFLTHGLPTEFPESTISNLSWIRIASSILGRISSPIFISSGANQHRTCSPCKSRCSFFAKPVLSVAEGLLVLARIADEAGVVLDRIHHQRLHVSDETLRHPRPSSPAVPCAQSRRMNTPNSLSKKSGAKHSCCHRAARAPIATYAA